MGTQMRAQQVRIVNFTQLEEVLKQPSAEPKVVNFWATWCGPCMKELPYFVQAQETYRNKNVKFIYVSLDFAKNSTKVQQTAAKKRLEGELLILRDNPNTYVAKIDPEWQGQIPVTVVVLRDGSYRVHKAAFENFEALKTFIDQHIK